MLRDMDTLDAYRFWAVGSVAGRGMDVLSQVLPFIVVGLVLAAGAQPASTCSSSATTWRARWACTPSRHKVVGVLAVMLLAGAATAACGPIAFVGLVVPHVARFLGGRRLPLGGALLRRHRRAARAAADIIGRVVVRPGELQVGIVMALVGGPVFVLLVRRSRMVRM